LRRRKPPMSYSGAQGTMTPNSRLQRTALPRRRWHVSISFIITAG
jgi:hypothetical protein